MKIYTKVGDKGNSQLIGGQKVSKSHPRLHAYGTLDELNCYIGLLRASISKENENRKSVFFSHLENDFQQLQNELFCVGSVLACDDTEMAKNLPMIENKSVEFLEKQIDQWTSELPTLREFILPGGHSLTSMTHICRTVTRRAERHTAEIITEGVELPSLIPIYLNRLSDYFFVMARRIQKELGLAEHTWTKSK